MEGAGRGWEEDEKDRKSGGQRAEDRGEDGREAKVRFR